MKNFILIACDEKVMPKSIEIYYLEKLVATVYVDQEILLHDSLFPDDVKQIVFIAENFFLLFNNINKAL